MSRSSPSNHPSSRAGALRAGARRCRPRVELLEDRLAPALLPPGFVEAPIASGISRATAMEIAPDGRLWVLEQDGDVEVFHAGSAAGFTALNLDPAAINSDGERGLLGIAFDPSYDIASPAADFVYLYYTSTAAPNPHNRVSRFTVNNANPDQPTLSGELVILELDALSGATNHNGGAMHFGPDGKLYIAVGDNANGTNAQLLTTLHGKMLRINATATDTFPNDNPFVDVTTGKNDAIWALGLRNPFTFAFQPGSGKMFINDVGQSAQEEINEGAAGANYGWPATEGDFNPAQFPGFTRPFYAYAHGGGTFEGFAITGGAFYNPTSAAFPGEFHGDYFFADFVNDWINVIDTTTRQVARFASAAGSPVDLRVADDGSLWYLSRGTGQVRRVVFTGAQPIAPTFAARINFQPPGSKGFRGFLADIGLPLGDKGNGLSFGWNFDNRATARNRNSARSPDERFDTFVRLPDGAVWEIAVPNGTYGVRVVAGDPAQATGRFGIDIEGVPALRGRPNATRRWIDRTVVVTVSDGRMTFTAAPGTVNNKINFVDIGPKPIRQAGGALGLVSIEAEHTSAGIPRGDRNWLAFTSPAGFSGLGLLQATPNVGAVLAPANSPRVDYRIRFAKAGIHYVWIRGLAPTAGDDTIHVGLNGRPRGIIAGLKPFYSWSSRGLNGARVAIQVAKPGLHTLNIWAREDGAAIDKIVLTTSAAYRPRGLGPAASPR
ncbi:MAG: PQQ-dependent sugar dehydrogenase [Gemmataceae bacterium]|nr:PQQ-dependent sugar dehydrogenase [Gemmataceae bacterium]